MWLVFQCANNRWTHHRSCMMGPSPWQWRSCGIRTHCPFVHCSDYHTGSPSWRLHHLWKKGGKWPKTTLNLWHAIDSVPASTECPEPQETRVHRREEQFCNSWRRCNWCKAINKKFLYPLNWVHVFSIAPLSLFNLSGTKWPSHNQDRQKNHTSRWVQIKLVWMHLHIPVFKGSLVCLCAKDLEGERTRTEKMKRYLRQFRACPCGSL